MIIKITPLTKKEDARGWLVENEIPLIRQKIKHFFVSVSRPNAIRGQHYHNRKREWFLVIKGSAEIFFKDLDSAEEKSIKVDSSNPELVEIPPKVAHSIKNIGNEEMILLAIVNEVLKQQDPDTYPYKLI